MLSNYLLLIYHTWDIMLNSAAAAGKSASMFDTMSVGYFSNLWCLYPAWYCVYVCFGPFWSRPDIHNVVSSLCTRPEMANCLQIYFWWLQSYFWWRWDCFSPEQWTDPRPGRINQNNHFSWKSHYHALIRHLKPSPETKRLPLGTKNNHGFLFWIWYHQSWKLLSATVIEIIILLVTLTCAMFVACAQSVPIECAKMLSGE